MSQQILFDEDNIDRFKTAMKKYGTWPTTVWDVDFSNRTTKTLKGLISDAGENRITAAEAFGYQDNASVFSPEICSFILNMFAPPEGVCFDPFAGGGTRAIMVAAKGLKYIGAELRQDEVDGIIKRCESNGIKSGIEIVCADSRDLSEWIRGGTADFCITCPPYWNLEKYNGGQKDLSMIEDYGEFIRQLGLVVSESYRILKPGALSCWVVGLHRHKSGWLAPLNHDVARLHSKAGFALQEEIVLSHKNNGAIQRVGTFEKGNRRLIRTHEYCLVFKK